MFAQTSDSPLPLFYEAMRDQFNRDEGGRSFLIAVAIFAVFFAFLFIVSRLERRPEKKQPVDHPGLVFRETLQKLGLAPAQLRLIETMTTDVKSPHPAALLISEKLFDEGVRKWNQGRGAELSREDRDSLAKARSRLFPSGAGWITSGPERV